MTDMKRLMEGVDPKADQRLSLESLAEAAETGPLDLSPAACSEITGLRCIRAASTHSLLAYRCNQGLLLYDRRSGSQYLLTTGQIEEMLFTKED